MSSVSSGDSFLGIIITSTGPSLFAHFFFRGFLSLEPIGLPRLRRALDSFPTCGCPYGTLIFTGALAAGMCDLVTLFRSVNASGT